MVFFMLEKCPDDSKKRPYSLHLCKYEGKTGTAMAAAAIISGIGMICLRVVVIGQAVNVS